MPVLLPGAGKGHLNLLLPGDVLHIPVEDSPTGLSEALPRIFEALDDRLPEDWSPGEIVQVSPLDELVLKLSDPAIREEENGVRRAVATAELRLNQSATRATAKTPCTSRWSFPYEG